MKIHELEARNWKNWSGKLKIAKSWTEAWMVLEMGKNCYAEKFSSVCTILFKSKLFSLIEKALIKAAVEHWNMWQETRRPSQRRMSTASFESCSYSLELLHCMLNCKFHCWKDTRHNSYRFHSALLVRYWRHQQLNRARFVIRRASGSDETNTENEYRWEIANWRILHF